MNILENKIKNAKKHKLCKLCNNELSVVFKGLFGENFIKVKMANIKYISGCCFDEEDYYYCDNCNQFFNRKLEVKNI